MASSANTTRRCILASANAIARKQQVQQLTTTARIASGTRLIQDTTNTFASTPSFAYNSNSINGASFSTLAGTASVNGATVDKRQQLYRYFSSTGGGSEGEKKDEAAAAAASDDEKKEEAAEEEVVEESEEQKQAKKIEQLEKQVKELKDQLMRSMADQENTRRIAKHDMDNARQMAIKGFAKSLLEVWDNLGRALEAAGTDETDAEKKVDPIYQGIEMTQTILQKAFESNGLKSYGAVGDKFDPQVHNAMAQYPDPTKEAGTVGQVLKAGFMLHKFVLRPADVMVVSKQE